MRNLDRLSLISLASFSAWLLALLAFNTKERGILPCLVAMNTNVKS